MEERSWVVSSLPSDAFRLSRLAQRFPDADVHFMHLGLETHAGRSHHRFLLSASDHDVARAWQDLKAFFTGELGATWKPLDTDGHDAIVVIPDAGVFGERTRELLRLWPKANLSCLRCRGDRTDLYALATSPLAAKDLEATIQGLFQDAGIEQRRLDAEERNWCSRLLSSPQLLAAMDQR